MRVVYELLIARFIYTASCLKKTSEPGRKVSEVMSKNVRNGVHARRVNEECLKNIVEWNQIGLTV